MGGRQGRTNGVRSGPAGLLPAPAGYIQDAKILAGSDLPDAKTTASIIKRANANGFNEASAAALLTAAKRGNIQGVNTVLDAFPRSIAGLELKTAVSVYHSGTLLTETKFLNRQRTEVGSMSRTIREGSASHDYFRLDSSVKGQGAGYKIFKHQVDAYTKNGLEKLSVSAAGGGSYNGGYTWGRFGYRFSNQDDRRQSLAAIDNLMRASGVSTKQRTGIMKKLDPNTARPGDIARVVATVNGKAQHLGKELMQDRSWAGVFDLTKGSADRKYMNSYPKVSKAIRAQTGAS